MPTKQRKIEVHKLTLSGLPAGTAYGPFLRDLRGQARPVAEMVRRVGSKSHALNTAELDGQRLRMRFLSYTKGHRPDVLDTNQFALQPNPMRPNQTGVEWTHILGGLSGNRYVLLIERNMSGVWPSTLEQYLQWMIDTFHELPPQEDGRDRDPITVSLEPEPGQEFLTRVNGLDRITEATVRIVRPNPGWQDLQNDLGDVARESDAQRADVQMTARRNDTLDKRHGILEWIRSKFRTRELDYASVKGQRGRETESFNTHKLGKHMALQFELDDRGQVSSEDAWTKLSQAMDNLD